MFLTPYAFVMGKEDLDGFRHSDMFEGVTVIRRHYHLMDVCRLTGDDEGERSNRIKAYRAGLKIMIRAEKDGSKREDLDGTLEWLRSRDYETHKFVTTVLEQAQATIDVVRRNRRPRRK